MKLSHRNLLLVALASLLLAVPPVAAAKKPPDLPGPGAPLPAKAKAYGNYCQGQSKKHVAGERGTPFSRCVTAMAKLATGKTSSPKVACQGMSKKHTAGEQGTPFSRCVAAGKQLLAEEAAGEL